MSFTIPQKNYPHLDVTRAVVRHMAESIQVPMDVDGSIVEEDVKVYVVKDRNFIETPNDPETGKPSVPHVRVAMPKTAQTSGEYRSTKRIEFDATQNNALTRGVVMEAPDQTDLLYKIMLVAQNDIVLALMMSNFVRAFPYMEGRLQVHDPVNQNTRWYDVSVNDLPDAKGADGNNDGLLTAVAEIAVHGVEYFTGTVCETPYTIHNFQIVVHRPDQQVVIDDLGNIKILPKSGG